MNDDKLYYETETLDGKAGYYTDYIAPYTEHWLRVVRPRIAPGKRMKLLDLGAGSCTTSMIVSREDFISEIVAADISKHRMETMIQEVARHVPGNIEKISFKEQNFNDDLSFDDDSFDIVMMDASLHHSRNIWHTLSEVRRVLRPGGIFVAQREAYTSPLTSSITFRRLLESPEVAAGVSENAYLKIQYDYYLRANGFIPEFVPALTRTRFKLLFFLNGIAFSKYNIIASSTKESARVAAN